MKSQFRLILKFGKNWSSWSSCFLLFVFLPGSISSYCLTRRLLPCPRSHFNLLVFPFRSHPPLHESHPPFCLSANLIISTAYCLAVIDLPPPKLSLKPQEKPAICRSKLAGSTFHFHVAACDTNRATNPQHIFLSSFPLLSIWDQTAFYRCYQNTNESYGPGNLYGQITDQEISVGVTDKKQEHKVNECFIFIQQRFPYITLKADHWFNRESRRCVF